MNLFNWVTTILGGGAVVWVALAIFAPSVLNVASSWLVAMSPLVQGVSEGLVNLGKRLWDGFLDVVDNINTIIFVALVALSAGLYVHFYAPKYDLKTCVAELRKEYKFVPKTQKEKESWLNKTFDGLWK